MTARRLFDDDEPPRLPFRLVLPDDDGSDTRIQYPGVGAQDGKKADLLSVFQSVQDSHQEDRPAIAPDVLESCRSGWPLHHFYDVVLAPWRRRQLGDGKIKAGSLQKERQSVRCFATWDADQQPENWPGGNIWNGLPVGFLAAHYFEKWAASRITKSGLAVDTVKSRWCQLRTVINWAVKLQVAPSACLPNLEPLFDKHRETAILADGNFDEFCPTTYTLAQLEAVYRELASEIDLQAAWVLGANAGPRTVDLFGLRWGVNVRLANDPPDLFYKAQKTGRKHWVPLAPCTALHLRRLAQYQSHLNPDEPGGLVFPRLTSGDNKDPEKSRAARARTERLKAALIRCGLDAAVESSDYNRPVQVLRATCSTRLNNHRPGKGLLVTHGKDASVNSKHYWDERDTIVEAVMSLPQPSAFLGM